MQNLIEDKPILAFETSQTDCGVCIYFNDKKYFSSQINLKHAHSEMIFEISQNLFELASIKPEDLDSIAVSEGPGSFTGLRIGYSAAKGIAFGAKLPIIPVPTYEALAYQLSFVLNENDEFIIANKVNKEEVYYCKFQLKSNNYIFVEDLIILTNELFYQKSNGLKVFGNARPDSETEMIYPNVPDPLFIAKWALKFGMKHRTFNYDFLEPNYLKEFIIKEYKK